MPTIEVMPITTPSTVRKERILLPRTVSNAMTTTSLIRPIRIAITRTYHSQHLERIEIGRLHRRVEAEEQADERGDRDAERHRPELDRRRNRRKRGDRERDGGAEHRPDDAAEHRQHDRL